MGEESAKDIEIKLNAEALHELIDNRGADAPKPINPPVYSAADVASIPTESAGDTQ